MGLLWTLEPCCNHAAEPWLNGLDRVRAHRSPRLVVQLAQRHAIGFRFAHNPPTLGSRGHF